MPPSIVGDTQQQMINLSACEFNEFSAFMIQKFGERQFKEGFTLIKANRTIMYEENGEHKLAELLKPLQFKDIDALRNFINCSTTYLIVQNMQC
jgi:hypothetical protein